MVDNPQDRTARTSGGWPRTALDMAKEANTKYPWFKGSTVYSTLDDSLVSPFIRSMMEAVDDKERDTYRLVFADWLDDHGRPDLASSWRSPRGMWQQWPDRSVPSWSVPHNVEAPWIGSTSHCLDWVAWPWIFPTSEWLRSDRCKQLVKVWIDGGVDLRDYPWAQQIAKAQGWYWGW